MKASEQVAELEREIDECKCGMIRATLLVNFGPEGRVLSGLVNPKMGIMNMLMTVLRQMPLAEKQCPYCKSTWTKENLPFWRTFPNPDLKPTGLHCPNCDRIVEVYIAGES